MKRLTQFVFAILVLFCAAGCRTPASRRVNKLHAEVSRDLTKVSEPLEFMTSWFYHSTGDWPEDRDMMVSFLAHMGAPLTLRHYKDITFAITEDGSSVTCYYTFTAPVGWSVASSGAVPDTHIRDSFKLSADEAVFGDREHVSLDPLLTLYLLLSPALPTPAEPAE